MRKDLVWSQERFYSRNEQMSNITGSDIRETAAQAGDGTCEPWHIHLRLLEHRAGLGGQLPWASATPSRPAPPLCPWPGQEEVLE